MSGTLWISSTPLFTLLSDGSGVEVAQYESSGDTVQMDDSEADMSGEVSRVENRVCYSQFTPVMSEIIYY